MADKLPGEPSTEAVAIPSRAHNARQETIRAIRVHIFGQAPRVDHVPVPAGVGPGELLVELAAAGVGAWDVGVASGRLAKLLPGGDMPLTMGAELCARVCALGAGVEDLAVGERVMANPGVFGAWAERVRLRASDCARAPQRVSDAEAATLPVRGLAAWQSLALLDLPADASLLVVGAGGAVGRAVVEIARGRGLRVLAVAGSGGLDMLRQLGAETAVDYRGEWSPRIAAAASGGVDAVLDLVGGDSLEQAIGLVRARGRVVSTVATGPRVASPAGVTFHFVKMKSSRAALTALAELVDAGGLSTRITKRFAFEAAPAALDAAAAPDREPGEIVLCR